MNTSHREDIQGLRALSVLAVILFHSNKDWLPGGFVGVDVFFVISGFLITSIILRQKENECFYFKEFYIRRMKRLLPAYLFMLTAVSVCMAILLINNDFGFYKESLQKSLYFASN